MRAPRRGTLAVLVAALLPCMPAEAFRPDAATQRWAMPVEGFRVGDLVDSFGAPRAGGKRRHLGIDIFAARGTPVLAVTSGTIAAIRDTPNGGRCLYLTSSNGYTFYYAHLDRWAAGLYQGRIVGRGEVLGYVGNSGNASGSRCHLHLEIEAAGRPNNPYVLLRTNVDEPHPSSTAAD